MTEVSYPKFTDVRGYWAQTVTIACALKHLGCGSGDVKS